MCVVNDTLNGISGTFWISSVRCDRTMQGDTTTVTLRKPCFEPAFGRYPIPPKLSQSIGTGLAARVKRPKPRQPKGHKAVSINLGRSCKSLGA